MLTSYEAYIDARLLCQCVALASVNVGLMVRLPKKKQNEYLLISKRKEISITDSLVLFHVYRYSRARENELQKKTLLIVDTTMLIRSHYSVKNEQTSKQNYLKKL